MKYAKVAVENTVYDFDKLFDYAVPVEYIAAAVPGCRVLVPFGRGNQKRQGVIFAICDKTSYDKIKPFSSLLDDAPVLSAEMIKPPSMTIILPLAFTGVSPFAALTGTWPLMIWQCGPSSPNSRRILSQMAGS